MRVRHWSPAMCPYRSLNCLKKSTSNRINDSGWRLLRVFCHSMSRLVSKRRRLAMPVSPSLNDSASSSFCSTSNFSSVFLRSLISNMKPISDSTSPCALRTTWTTSRIHT
ncbi:hypothetical protein D3C71_1893000 [compost metagenome]